MNRVRSWIRSWKGCVASAFVVGVIACGHGSGSTDVMPDNPALSAADASTQNSPGNCLSGMTTACRCDDGGLGTRACTNDSTLAPCVCAPPNDTKATCGDRLCSPSETCKFCPQDCGECPKCSLAPACSDGVALPSHTQEVKFDDLSNPAPPPTNDAGALLANTCGGAQLRLRIARIQVEHQGKQVYLPTGTLDGSPQSYYCIIQATDGAIVPSAPDAGNGTVEVALTRPTAQIPDHQGADFAPTDSIFWGQQGPRMTVTNLTMTYSCFQQKDSGDSAWKKVFDAAGNAAGALANAGPYGWAFGLGSVGLKVVGAAIDAAQSQGDWHMFDVTHTIDKSWLLELTNGRKWKFTRDGGDEAFHYPWSLTVIVESWGCADPLPNPAH